jgi:hypothetical protein
MPGTLAFAPTPDDLEDDLFSVPVPVLTFAPPPQPTDDTEED